MRRAAHNVQITKERESIWEMRTNELELNLFNVSREYQRHIYQLHQRLLEQEKIMESQKNMNVKLLAMFSEANDRINEHSQQLKAMTCIHQTYCQLFASLSVENPPFQNVNNLLRFYKQRPMDPLEIVPSFVNTQGNKFFRAPSPFSPDTHPDMHLNAQSTRVDDFVKGVWCNTDNTDN